VGGTEGFRVGLVLGLNVVGLREGIAVGRKRCMVVGSTVGV